MESGHDLKTSGRCLSCQVQFDNGPHLPMRDQCGHERCYQCLVNLDSCPMCPVQEGQPKKQQFRNIQAKFENMASFKSSSGLVTQQGLAGGGLIQNNALNQIGSRNNSSSKDKPLSASSSSLEVQSILSEDNASTASENVFQTHMDAAGHPPPPLPSRKARQSKSMKGPPLPPPNKLSTNPPVTDYSLPNLPPEFYPNGQPPNFKDSYHEQFLYRPSYRPPTDWARGARRTAFLPKQVSVDAAFRGDGEPMFRSGINRDISLQFTEGFNKDDDRPPPSPKTAHSQLMAHFTQLLHPPLQPRAPLALQTSSIKTQTPDSGFIDSMVVDTDPVSKSHSMQSPLDVVETRSNLRDGGRSSIQTPESAASPVRHSPASSVSTVTASPSEKSFHILGGKNLSSPSSCGNSQDSLFSLPLCTPPKLNSTPSQSPRGPVMSPWDEPRKTPDDLWRVPLQTPDIELNLQVPDTEIILGAKRFFGRGWLFKAVLQELQRTGAKNSRGVVLSGEPGSGKSAVMNALVDYSAFGSKKLHIVMPDHLSNSPSVNSHQTSVLDPSFVEISSRIIAFHACHSEDSFSCQLPVFVHKLISCLYHCPLLTAYRALVENDARLQRLLTPQQSTISPTRVMREAVIEPLERLYRSGRITGVFYILIDGLDEGEYHRPDYGQTVTSFIGNLIGKFPVWIKFIVTVSTALLDITQHYPCQHVLVDAPDDCATDDFTLYISNTLDLAQFAPDCCKRVLSACHRNFLHCSIVVELLSQGLVMLDSRLPATLHEALTTVFTHLFPTAEAYSHASVVLSLCATSLYPLTAKQLHECLMIQYGRDQAFRLLGTDVKEILASLSSILMPRADRSYCFVHPFIKEWLIQAPPEGAEKQFLIDPRKGHASLALLLSCRPCTTRQTLELGHHILKAHIYKGLKPCISSRNLSALWLQEMATDLDGSLTNLQNVFFPNVKVSRLLLQAGTQFPKPGRGANASVQELQDCPLICVAAREGHRGMVELLLEFGANVNAVANDGKCALAFAAERGHIDVIRVLADRNAQLNQTDMLGLSPVVHAAKNGQLDAASFLLQCDWTTSKDQPPSRREIVAQSLVAAAGAGHLKVVDFLLNLRSAAKLDMDLTDTLQGQTPLGAACSGGHLDVVQLLLDIGATVAHPDAQGDTPLVLASKSGHWTVIELLMDYTAAPDAPPDADGRTALMVAAAHGCVQVVELLIRKGASVHGRDTAGMTALCWACIGGNLRCVQALLSAGSDIEVSSRPLLTPLAYAATHGHAVVVQFLLEQHANMESQDYSGWRPFEHAIDRDHKETVICFLRRGVKLANITWVVAAGHFDIILHLLYKLIEDGKLLYEQHKISEALQRFQYALKRVPEVPPESSHQGKTVLDMKVFLLLNYSKCKRKLGECLEAVDLASQALDLAPNSVEALYARARARRDVRLFDAAVHDLEAALRLSPNNTEIKQLLIKVMEEEQASTIQPDVIPKLPASQTRNLSNEQLRRT